MHEEKSVSFSMKWSSMHTIQSLISVLKRWHYFKDLSFGLQIKHSALAKPSKIPHEETHSVNLTHNFPFYHDIVFIYGSIVRV